MSALIRVLVLLVTLALLVVATFAASLAVGPSTGPGWPIAPRAAAAATPVTRIAYGVQEVGGIALYTIRTNGTWKRQLNNFGDIDVDPAYAPNGAAVAFVRIHPATAALATSYELRYAVTGRDSAVVYRSRNGISAPTFSPDGGRLAVSLETVTGARIYSVAVDGSAPRWLTNTVARPNGPLVDDREPSFAPGGQDVVFSRRTAGYPETAQLWRTSLVSGVSTTLTRGGFIDRAPAWSRDGKRILFVRDESDPSSSGTFGVSSVAAAGGTPVVVIPKSAPRIGDLAWSPDGKQFAFCSESRRTNVKGGVFIANADGTGERAARLEVGEVTSVAWGPPPL